MDYGDALRMLKAGRRVERPGWNGRGMWVFRCPGYPEGAAVGPEMAEVTGLPEGTTARFLQFLMLRTADGACVPWATGQPDMEAVGWRVRDGGPPVC